MRFEPEVLDELDATQRAQILALVAEVTAVDGTDPLNEAARMSLESGARSARHILLVGPTGPEAYANLQHTGAAETIQLAVAPEARFTGLGTAVLATALAIVPDGATGAVWSFGDLPAARGFARTNGLRPVRELLVMESLLDTVPSLRLPAGVTIRGFRADDEAAVLDVNARAFAHHPEQGAMDTADFAARRAEPWFRAEDLLVAERDGQVVGFHWTKRHDSALWEVYVIGVDPDLHGGGIGKALLRAGMRHMADERGQRVQLYVEGDQETAIGLYRAHGFRTTHKDVLYAPA
ncbi:mycothiol synthase [Raineyella fluvialis]|uniref:Mycothiol acetyltransferase n=1 Tax=Raineyella fluvialis TaxID=2662261 RepID=A0A5Q2FC58_9ACTN|nr:mycothiol synthase [Raineyella fluvialis]QGF23971.1 mycothiol synthase [Raineyella fluvialis]